MGTRLILKQRFLYSQLPPAGSWFGHLWMDLCQKEFPNKVQPWSQKNVHHWEDEVGEEVVVNLGEFPSEGGRIPESGFKIVSYALRDHCNLFQKIKNWVPKICKYGSTIDVYLPKAGLWKIMFMPLVTYSHAAHQEEEVKDCESNQEVVEVALETAPAWVGQCCNILFEQFQAKSERVS